MKKIFYILIILIFQNNIIFASFPVDITGNFSKVEITSQTEVDGKELTQKQKIDWVLIGLSGGIVGLIIALVTNLTSKKKKQQFKYALFGFIGFLILNGLISYYIFDEIPYGLDEIGKIFILS